MKTSLGLQWVAACGVGAAMLVGTMMGCGDDDSTTSSSSSTSGATGTSGTSTGTSGNTSGGTSGAGTSSGGTSGSPADAGGDAASGGDQVTLTINNYLNWCSVVANGAPASTATPITVKVAKGTTVNLSADKASDTFVFGYWRGTAGDKDDKHDKNKATTVVVNADTKVQACCPFASAPDDPCGAF